MLPMYKTVLLATHVMRKRKQNPQKPILYLLTKSIPKVKARRLLYIQEKGNCLLAEATAANSHL